MLYVAVKRAILARHPDRLTSRLIFMLKVSDKTRQATNILMLALKAFQNVRAASGLVLTLTLQHTAVSPALRIR